MKPGQHIALLYIAFGSVCFSSREVVSVLPDGASEAMRLAANLHHGRREIRCATNHMDVRGVSRVLPDLDDELLVELFHKGARAQWTSRDLDFASPLRLNAKQAQ